MSIMDDFHTLVKCYLLVMGIVLTKYVSMLGWISWDKGVLDGEP